MPEWKNRIVGQRMADPKTLKANQQNWRLHPEAQRKALAEVMDTVGWVDQILVNWTTGNMIDGHLRVDEAIAREEAEVPVLEVELSEEEERLVLATLDPLSAMAATDWDKLDELVKGVPEWADIYERHVEKKFDPVDENTQGQLDEIKPRIVVCPSCGHEFQV